MGEHCFLSSLATVSDLDVFPVEDIGILGAVHQDLGSIAVLNPTIPPVTLISLAHSSPLAVGISHDRQAVATEFRLLFEQKSENTFSSIDTMKMTEIYKYNRVSPGRTKQAS